MIVTMAACAVVSACDGARQRVTGPDGVAGPSASQQSREMPPNDSSPPLPVPPVERDPQPPREELPPSGTCNATAAQWTIGQPASDALLQHAKAAAGAAVARFLRPNEPITLEWLGARLNLELDGRGVVRSVRCG